MILNRRTIFGGFALLFYSLLPYGANAQGRWDVGGTIGANIGATMPIPVPKEIKEIYRYYPNMNGTVSVWLNYRRGKHWGVNFGLEAEQKAFETTTRAEDLPINLFDTQGQLYKALYTGDQNTSIKALYLTLPLTATYHTTNNRLRLQAGGYLAYRLSGSFVVKLDGDGTVDGVPRNPGGILPLDFASFAHRWDVGLRLGADYYLTNHLGVTLNVNYALVPYTKSAFNALDNRLRHLYATIGISCRILGGN